MRTPSLPPAATAALARHARWLVPAVVTLASALLLLTRLDTPERIVFDETYYVNDARAMLETGVEDGFAVHPPVGKWLIAAGIALLGDTPVGWRFPTALAGVLTVLLTTLLAQRLTGRASIAALAGGLLAVDGMLIVQSRTSMLDQPLALFVVLGIWLVVLDRDRAGLLDGPPDPPAAPDDADPDELAPPPPALPRRGHPFRVLAGVAFGLAIGTKWSGALGLGAAGLLVLGWELGWRRRWTGRWHAALPRLVGSVGLGLVVVPLVVYALAWVPWLVQYPYTHEAKDECRDEQEQVVDPCGVSPVGRVAGLWRFHLAIARFHDGLEATHPYRASPVTWPVIARPVVYYYETCSQDRFDRVPETDGETGEVTVPDPCVVERGQAAEMIGMGNPATWWGFLAAAPLLLAGWRRRDGVAAVAVVAWLSQYVPWLAVSRPAFFFYTVPIVPFVALGVAVAVGGIDPRRRWRWTYGGALAGALLGLGLGFGLAMALGWQTWGARLLPAGVGWALGALVGARVDDARGPLPGPPRVRRRLVPTVVLAGLALGLFVYFAPVWLGIPMDEALVRQRWWFPGWV
ncbi:MAG: phospholipid carrier-dependent glycosyltransferase [Actinomycetes bacterium]